MKLSVLGTLLLTFLLFTVTSCSTAHNFWYTTDPADIQWPEWPPEDRMKRVFCLVDSTESAAWPFYVEMAELLGFHRARGQINFKWQGPKEERVFLREGDIVFFMSAYHNYVIGVYGQQQIDGMIALSNFTKVKSAENQLFYAYNGYNIRMIGSHGYPDNSTYSQSARALLDDMLRRAQLD